MFDSRGEGREGEREERPRVKSVDYRQVEPLCPTVFMPARTFKGRVCRRRARSNDKRASSFTPARCCVNSWR